MRKTEEKRDAPPFIINTREFCFFFLRVERAIFKIRVVHPKSNAYETDTNILHSRRNSSLSHTLCVFIKTKMSKGCQQLIANLRAFRSLVAGLSSTSSVSSFSSRSGGSVRSSNMNSSFSSHHVQRRSYGGATPKGSSYFSEGTQTKRNGLLFGETPPLKGQKRIRESWELPYFVTFFSAGVILCVGLNGKPDTSLVGWAKEEARKRLEKEEEDER